MVVKRVVRRIAELTESPVRTKIKTSDRPARNGNSGRARNPVALLDIARPDINQLIEQRHAVLIGVVEVQPQRATLPSGGITYLYHRQRCRAHRRSAVPPWEHPDCDEQRCRLISATNMHGQPKAQATPYLEQLNPSQTYPRNRLKITVSGKLGTAHRWRRACAALAIS
jgi:hypothetical protein